MTGTKTARLLTLLLAFALLATGCARRDMRNEFFGKIAPPEGQILRYISGSEPESLDPQIEHGAARGAARHRTLRGAGRVPPEDDGGDSRHRRALDDNRGRERVRLPTAPQREVLQRRSDHRPRLRLQLPSRPPPELASRTAYLAYDIKYAEAFNAGGAFVRDPRAGRFLLASETPSASPDGAQTQPASLAPPPDEEALFKTELGKKGEDAAPDTPFHKFIHAPERLVVPADEKDRAKALKADAKLAALVEGKEFVPVKAEDVGVEAVDDYTLRVTLRQPAPYFLGLLPHQFFRAVHEKTVEQYGVNWTKPGNIVSSGTHMLAEHKPYNQVVVVKNPHYWDAASVRLEKIRFYPLEDNTTMMNLYKAGEVDAIYNHTVPASWLERHPQRRRTTWTRPRTSSSTTRSTRPSRRWTTCASARPSTWRSTRTRSPTTASSSSR